MLLARIRTCTVCLLATLASSAVTATDDLLPPDARFRIGSERFVHQGQGTNIALSPNEKFLVSSGDGKLICWDTATGKAIWSENIPDEVDSAYGNRPIAFQRDSRKFYFQSGPSELLQCDVLHPTLTPLTVQSTLPLTPTNRPASALPGSIRSVDVNQDGTRIAAAGGHGVVVCDRRGVCLFELPNSPERAMDPEDWEADPGLFGGHYSSAVFSHDGSKLAVLLSQSPHQVSVCDATTGQELRTFQCKSRVVQVEFAPDGNSLTTVERSGALTSFSTNTGDVQWQMESSSPPQDAHATSRPPATMQYTADGKRILFASSKIVSIDAATGKVLFESSTLTNAARSLALANKSNVLYAMLTSGKILRMDLATGKWIDEQLSLQAPHLLVAAALSTKFAFVDSQGAVRVSDTTEAREPNLADVHYSLPNASLPNAQIQRLAMSRDGNRIAAAVELNRELNIVTWSTRNGSQATKATLKIPVLPEATTPDSKIPEPIKLLEFSPNSTMLVSASTNSTQALLWNVDSGTLVAKVDHPLLNCLTFTSTGTQLITGGADDTLRFWDCTTGALLATREVQGGELQNVRCSPASDLLVTAHFPNVLRYWKASDMSLKKRTPLSGETNFEVLDFSTNGSWLLTTSSGYLLVIDANSGNILWKNAYHPSERVIQAAFSSNDKRLLSAGRDGIGYCWDLLPTNAVAKTDFDKVWQTLREDGDVDVNQQLWQLVKMGDEAVDRVESELQPVSRVVNIKAISRGLNQQVAAHRESLANRLTEKDNSVELESRVRYALNFLVLLRSPKAIKLLEQLASGHACKEIRQEANTALNQLK